MACGSHVMHIPRDKAAMLIIPYAYVDSIMNTTLLCCTTFAVQPFAALVSLPVIFLHIPARAVDEGGSSLITVVNPGTQWVFHKKKSNICAQNLPEQHMGTSHTGGEGTGG